MLKNQSFKSKKTNKKPKTERNEREVDHIPI